MAGSMETFITSPDQLENWRAEALECGDYPYGEGSAYNPAPKAEKSVPQWDAADRFHAFRIGSAAAANVFQISAEDIAKSQPEIFAGESFAKQMGNR